MAAQVQLGSVAKVFKPTTSRSMFVKVQPVPRRFSERRAVLQTLQKYGAIEMFKRNTSPNSFTAIATEESTVTRLIENSPIQFDHVSGYSSDQQGPDPAHRPARPGMPKDIYELHRAMSAPKEAPNSFVLHIFPAKPYHRGQIDKVPIYGPWPEDNAFLPVRPFSATALAVSAPDDMSRKGLVDWETGGQLLEKFEETYPNRPRLVRAMVERRKERRDEKEQVKRLLELGNYLQTFDE